MIADAHGYAFLFFVCAIFLTQCVAK